MVPEYRKKIVSRSDKDTKAQDLALGLAELLYTISHGVQWQKVVYRMATIVSAL